MCRFVTGLAAPLGGCERMQATSPTGIAGEALPRTLTPRKVLSFAGAFDVVEPIDARAEPQHGDVRET